MFSQEEATKERVDAFVEAMTAERAGYTARLERLANGKPDLLTSEQLDARVTHVDEQLARFQKPSKGRRTKADKKDA